MTFDTKIILTGIVFLITGVTGIILSRLGKPYNTVMFNIHKLIALAVLVYTIILSVKLFKGTEEDKYMIILLPIIILLSVGAFVSGGILSVKDDPAKIVATIHKILSIVISLESIGIIAIMMFVKH